MPRLAKRRAATGSWQSMLWARKVFHQRRPGTTANGRVSTSRSSASGISKEMATKKHKKTQKLELHFLCAFLCFLWPFFFENQNQETNMRIGLMTVAVLALLL